jgi:hypothetical protein
MRTRAIGVARQRRDGVFDFLPDGRLEITGDARSGVFRALSRKGKRVAVNRNESVNPESLRRQAV